MRDSNQPTPPLPIKEKEMKCPICGKDPTTTSLICLNHISFEYDGNGNLIAYTDMVQVSAGCFQSVRYPVKENIKVWAGWQQRVKESIN